MIKNIAFKSIILLTYLKRPSALQITTRKPEPFQKNHRMQLYPDEVRHFHIKLFFLLSKIHIT
jgi:hypothetical protein